MKGRRLASGKLGRVCRSQIEVDEFVPRYTATLCLRPTADDMPSGYCYTYIMRLWLACVYHIRKFDGILDEEDRNVVACRPSALFPNEGSPKATARLTWSLSAERIAQSQVFRCAEGITEVVRHAQTSGQDMYIPTTSQFPSEV